MQAIPSPTSSGRWSRTDSDYLALVNEWHVVARSAEVTAEKPPACTLLGERLVLWRADGVAHAWPDYCPHRGAPLSCGRIQGNRIACPYHGWEFDARGYR